MEKHIISKLLDVKQMLPNMSWNVDSSGVLTMTVWLVEEDANMLRQGQKMFAPKE